MEEQKSDTNEEVVEVVKEPRMMELEPARNTFDKEFGEVAERALKREFSFEQLMLRAGGLKWEQYKKLSPQLQKQYRRLHGQPKTPQERQATKKQKIKSRTRRKMASQSRKANR